MKFTVSREKFVEALQTLQNVVSTRTTLPILSNVLLQCDEEGLRLTTTDLEMGMSGKIEAKVERPGGTTLPARKLASIVRELPVADIQFDVDAKNVASIRSGPSFFKINGLPHEEFPPLQRLDSSRDFVLPQAALRDALKKTSYAISTDESRFVLNGILFSFKDNRITLVATDGRRLAMVGLETEFPRSDEVDFILPTKAVNELERILGNEGDVKISMAGSHAGFDLGHLFLLTKLVEGNYPNYRQVLPGDPKERVTLERENFLNAVHRVSLLTTEKSNSVKLVFGKGTLDISANTPEVGEAKESLAINYKGREMAIAFNPEFMMAPLRNLSNDEVFIDLIDEMSPIVLKIPSPTTFLYVLMPMRVS